MAEYTEEQMIEYILPIFEECVEKLKNNDSFVGLFLDKGLDSAVTMSFSSSSGSMHYKVGLPMSDVIDAMDDTLVFIRLYSGKHVGLTARTVLKREVIHEVAHCFHETGQKDLDEGIADIISLDKIMDENIDGEALAAVVVSDYLVEANLLGYLEISDVNEIKLPFKFSKYCLDLMQNELNYYFSNQDKVAEKFMKKEEDRGDDLSIYSRGFFRALSSLPASTT